MNPGLTLLGKPSSINVRKVLWLCRELGLEPALEPWGSGHRDTRVPEFLALNPNGLVPVLRDGDLVLWESNTICRYLAAREGRSDLLPADPAGRARIEQWMDWQATELNSSWRYAFMALVRQHHQFADPGAIEAGVAQWNRHMAIRSCSAAAASLSGHASRWPTSCWGCRRIGGTPRQCSVRSCPPWPPTTAAWASAPASAPTATTACPDHRPHPPIRPAGQRLEIRLALTGRGR